MCDEGETSQELEFLYIYEDSYTEDRPSQIKECGMLNSAPGIVARRVSLQLLVPKGSLHRYFALDECGCLRCV